MNPRYFLALSLPSLITEPFTNELTQYAGLIKKRVPKNMWHLTLAFLGEQELTPEQITLLSEPIQLPFAPVITFKKIGLGLAPNQLWAFAHPNASILGLRKAVLSKLQTAKISPHDINRTYIPHIKMADLELSSSLSNIPTTPLTETFCPNSFTIFRSVPTEESVEYEVLGQCSLSS